MFDDDPRWGDSRERDNDPRDLDGRDRELSDPRDVFMRELDLPRTDERQRVHDRDREYSLRGSERARWRSWARFAWCPRAT